ncbi:hypothetical protein S245_017075 [Arachis hypogaea]
MLYYLARVYTTNTILKVYSNAPDGNEPLALDMERMGKGQVWINGESIGRYWMTYGNGGCNSYGYPELIPLC